MLDASKAFDRVNHFSLFNKLKLRNMCPTILKFLMCTYQRQCVIVIWNGECSSTFSVDNGVKTRRRIITGSFYLFYLDCPNNNIYLKSNIQCI